MIPKQIIYLFTFIFFNLFNHLSAHEIKPAIVEFNKVKNQINIVLKFNAEAFLANIDASFYKETINFSNSIKYSELRLLPGEILKEKVFESRDQIINSIFIKTSKKQLNLKLVEIDVLEEKNIEKVRFTKVYLKTENKFIETPITFSTKKIFGPLIFKNFSNIDKDTEKPQSQWLKPGNQTSKLGILQVKTNITNFLILGIWNGILQIIVYGFDHILFILGLFFFSHKLKPLLIQVTTFTIAHSITLIFGGLGYITISPLIIEVIIAVSIIWVGFENLFRKNIKVSRIGVIFTFGLIHGLGFASMFKLIGLEGIDYYLNLLSFNIGIELGQLITLLPLIILIPLFNRLSWYRILIAIPASIIIALFGVEMFIDRIL
tara:strand:- start:924 stop:2051 length:1128 start_codon:yes stop_codon:yes gene_type:complete